MKARIYCKPTSKDVHSFFLVADGREYYLFAQRYRKSVQRYFGKGTVVNNIYNFTKAKENYAIIHTLVKLPGAIRYVEKEYDIAVLKKTRRVREAVRREMIAA